MNRVNADVDPDDFPSNPSGNRHFRDVLSRRALFKGGTVVGAAAFLTAGPGSASDTAAPGGRRPGAPGKGLLGFKAVPAGTADAIVVPEGYSAQVLIPWGTPIRKGGPAFKKDASNTAAEQERQVGAHHDGMHLFPLSKDSGLLTLNHEYVDTMGLYSDGDAVITKEKVAKALAAHGVSVVKVQFDRRSGKWAHVDSRFNRRVTGNTPVRFSGPVKGDHEALQANDPPRGTLNNCSSGHTPWGTYLACEENWNGYFGTDDAAWKPGAEEKRYGVAATTPYRWHQADERFDVAKNPKEPNRFGWVVEIDPFAPDSTPVKRTALGRIKHEGATVTESKGRVVVYTGDDQDGEYVYKFVGDGRWRDRIRRGQSPLDHGTLYVAKFNDDGSGVWLPLVFGEGPLTAAGGW
jgi:secreted PhoX family phosphatase